MLNKGLKSAHGAFGKVAVEGSSTESMEVVIDREKRGLRDASKNASINNSSQGPIHLGNAALVNNGYAHSEEWRTVPKKSNKVWILIDPLACAGIYDLNKARVIDMDFIRSNADDWAY